MKERKWFESLEYTIQAKLSLTFLLNYYPNTLTDNEIKELYQILKIEQT